METKNHYESIDYGEGKKILTRKQALRNAYDEVIPKLLNDSKLDIVGNPEIIEFERKKRVYVRVSVKR